MSTQLIDHCRENIISRLILNGYKAYIVGGAVRDYYLGREISDIDIATSAKADQIKEVFKDKKLIEFGSKFGTIKVIADGISYEITTFRQESNYKDSRHPSDIVFKKNIEDDLKRRDFTINAMAMDIDGNIIDPFDGRNDLDRKILKAVGNPDLRIKEDLLRSLRAVRFMARLDLTIEENLKKAIKENASNIANLSKERLQSEISKIILEDKPSKGIIMLEDLGLLEKIMPAISKMVGFNQHSSFHKYDLFVHSMKALDNTEADLSLRLAALYHDCGKIETFFLDERGEGRFFNHQKVSEYLMREELNELRYPKKLIDEISNLILRHMDCSNTYSKKSIRKLVRRLSEDMTRKLLKLQKADIQALPSDDISNIINGEILLNEVMADDIPKKRSDLAINGNDLKQLGYKEGKIIGDTLDLVEKLILEEKLSNEKSEIIKFLRLKLDKLDSKEYK